MTGRKIARSRFPARREGYNATYVDSFLSEIADLRDKGFAAADYTLSDGSCRRMVRGYVPDAVDQYLAELAREAAAAGLRALPAVPTSNADYLRLKGAQRRQYESDRQAEHGQVRDLPGLRLRCTSFNLRAAGTVSGSAGEVILTRRRAITLATGQVLRLDYSGPPMTLPRYELQLTDPATAEPVLWIRRKHDSWGAWGRVLLPGRRCFTFPVSGTSRRNAVMTAVSEFGTTMLWFRHIRWHEYDVVVSPDCDLTPEILCMIELAARWLVDYFRSSG